LVRNPRSIAPTRLLAAAALLCVVSCQVAPPPARVDGPAGRVRAAHRAEAEAIREVFEDLGPRIAALLPDADCRAEEVWVQAEPGLYRFSGNSYAEADGFWSESHRRIHLRQDAESLPRTLAHELVHASIGSSWSALPGTLEEGLCDVVSVLLCPDDAIEMRTGRLSAAAFATGGLELEVELYLPPSAADGALQVGSLTRMRLQGPVAPSFDPEDVFAVEAGLSTTQLPTNDKKALYGLSYLVVHRIVERIGFVGLHQLCVSATEAGYDEVPTSWLLDAAGLSRAGRREWRAALQQEIGIDELTTLVRLYPDLLVDSAARFLGRQTQLEGARDGAAPVSACVRVTGAGTQLSLDLDVGPDGLRRAAVTSLPETTGRPE